MAGNALISVEEAQAKLLALAQPLDFETVPVEAGYGRYLAKAVIAQRDQPPFDASAMDGYAISDQPQLGQSYQIIGESGAGHGFTGVIGTGQAVRIFTGAPLPTGANRVVIQENVTRDGDQMTITALDANSGPHIRKKGQDFAQGSTLSPRRMRPVDLGLAAAMNCPELTVYRKPKVAIVATGDELVLPGQTPGPDQIIASNNFSIKALCEEAGAEVILLPLTPDTVEAHRAAFTHALDIADVMVTIGGASVGDHDLVGPVAKEMGLDPAFWKVALRPGKPLLAGKLGRKIMLGLPGNPVSALICGQLFLVPLLRALQGDPSPLPRKKYAPLAQDIAANGPRSHYMRAVFDDHGQIAPVTSQDSNFLSTFANADALLIRPVHDQARSAGDLVPYLPL